MAITVRNMTTIYLLKDEKILLLYRQGSRVVNNVWIGSAGGHLEAHEMNEPESCVLREMQEELSLSPDDITPPQLRYVTMRMTNGEIRQNYYFFANLKENIGDGFTSNEGKLKWFSIKEIGDLEMPYTAKYVMKHYCSIGQFSEKLYMGATNEKGVDFIELPEF